MTLQKAWLAGSFSTSSVRCRLGAAPKEKTKHKMVRFNPS